MSFTTENNRFFSALGYQKVKEVFSLFGPLFGIIYRNVVNNVEIWNLCFISSKLTTLFTTLFNSLHLYLWKLPYHACCSLHLGRFIIYYLWKQPLSCLDVYKDYTKFVLILMHIIAKCLLSTPHFISGECSASLK